LLCAALVYWYGSRLRRIRTVEAMLGMLVISIVGVHSLLELPHHYAYFLVPAGLWAGVVEREIGATTIGSARLMTVPVLAALAVFVAMAFEYPAVEADFTLVRFEHARVGELRATVPAPDAPLLSSLTAFLRVARTEPVLGMSDSELREIAESTKRYPYALSLSRYAAALALNGRLEDARRTFVKIRYIYGDRAYVRLREDLHEQVAQGKSGLAELENTLPPVDSLRP
jgi:hypothetical protein